MTERWSSSRTNRAAGNLHQVDTEDEKADSKGMDVERLAKLEGAYDALKVVRPMTVTVFGLVLAVVIGGFAFLGNQNARLEGRIENVNSKVSGLQDQVQQLPDKINAGLRDITKTLAESITAAKQTPPQVILMQAPPLRTSPDDPSAIHQ